MRGRRVRDAIFLERRSVGLAVFASGFPISCRLICQFLLTFSG